MEYWDGFRFIGAKTKGKVFEKAGWEGVGGNGGVQMSRAVGCRYVSDQREVFQTVRSSSEPARAGTGQKYSQCWTELSPQPQRTHGWEAHCCNWLGKKSKVGWIVFFREWKCTWTGKGRCKGGEMRWENGTGRCCGKKRVQVRLGLRWLEQTGPRGRPSGYNEVRRPQPHRQGAWRVRCGRRRKWESGSESIAHRKMAKREAAGTTLRGVICNISKSCGEATKCHLTLEKRWRRKARASKLSLRRRKSLKCLVTMWESLYGLICWNKWACRRAE